MAKQEELERVAVGLHRWELELGQDRDNRVVVRDWLLPPPLR